MKEFVSVVMEYYQVHGRHDLPWREKSSLNPYAIAVSEVMLQQTQVSRVMGYFTQWMQQFPGIQTLANANNDQVLRTWQGLGYNNRGLRLKKLAEVIIDEYNGKFPKDRALLEALPGIGPYTAGAIRAFVWNEPEVFVETNIRRVLLHHFFAGREGVGDKEIMSILENLVEYIETPREFYWALMDYGSSLPKITKTNANTRSKHYAKQSRFEGSVRQVRSGILKWLLDNQSVEMGEIAHILGIVDPNDERIFKAVNGLVKDAVIESMDTTIRLKL